MFLGNNRTDSGGVFLEVGADGGGEEGGRSDNATWSHPACEYIFAQFSDAAQNNTITSPLLVGRYLEKGLIGCADVVSIVGNVLVIVTICFNMRLRRTVASLLLLSLSSANLLFSLVVVPVHILQPQFMHSTNFACKFFRALQTTSVVASALTLVSIAVERYFAICRPMESLGRQTVRHVYPLMAGIWTASIITSTPLAIAAHSAQIDCGSKVGHLCYETWWSDWWDLAYTVTLFLLIVIIPSSAMATMYYFVARAISGGQAPQLNQQHFNPNVPNNNAPANSNGSCVGPAAYPLRINRRATLDRNCPSKRRKETSTISGTSDTRLTNAAVEVTGHPKDSCDVLVARRNSSSNIRAASQIPRAVVKFKKMQSQVVLDQSQKQKNSTNQSDCTKTNPLVVVDPRSSKDSNPRPSGVEATQNEESVVQILMRTEPDISSWRSRLVYMLIVIVVGHVVCWGPVHLMHVLIRVSSDEFQVRPIIRYLMAASYFLENISGCINPITFCFMSKGFRATLVCLVCRLKSKFISS